MCTSTELLWFWSVCWRISRGSSIQCSEATAKGTWRRPRKTRLVEKLSTTFLATACFTQYYDPIDSINIAAQVPVSVPTSFLSTNHLLTTYRPPSDRPSTDHLLTDHLPTTYRPPIDHLLTTCRPPTDHFFTVQLVHDYHYWWSTERKQFWFGQFLC